MTDMNEKIEICPDDIADDNRDVIVFDLEATCWSTGMTRERMEMIEIGAVRLQGPEYRVGDKFQTFVCPVEEPILSEFCRELTSIRQSDVDGAPRFPEALEQFRSWVGNRFGIIGSWGNYDRSQIEIDCRRHHQNPPEFLERHVNLKAMFSHHYHVKPKGMKRALKILNIPLEGDHHRAIDDAINIAAITRRLLAESEMGISEWIEIR